MLILKRNENAVKSYGSNGVQPFRVSRRNKKLVPNSKTAFIIWNLPAVKTCPYRTALCEKYCYAKKAENVYPTCKPSRERNFAASLAPDFVERMTYTILKIRRGCKSKNLVVRIHESGDFYNKEYVNKWIEIMNRCKGEKITFIAYTKSFVFFDGLQLPDNFRLRASIWSDTKQSDIDIINRNNWSIYTAVEKFEKGDKFTRCRCKDCATCSLCWSLVKDIRCEIH